jgi:alkylglycerol monooxygenase
MEHLSTVIAIPVFLLMILVEYFATRKEHPEYYRLNDALTNLNVGVSHLLFKLLTTGLMFGAYVWTKDHFAMVELSGLWAYVVVFILFDFCFYWAHRVGHEVNLFWGAHVVHHQSEEYNLTVALRQSWIHSLLAFVFFLPIAFLGVDILTLGIVASLNSFYQFWIHTKAVKRMPKWFEAIFNSPAHHRVHHGVNPKYIDKNHAGMFIIWDKLFGTFQEEEEEPTYGITKPLNSWNPAWANIHYYVEMYQAGKKFNSIKDKLKLVFAKPGWQPAYLGGQLAIPEVNPQTSKIRYTSREPWVEYLRAGAVCIYHCWTKCLFISF